MSQNWFGCHKGLMIINATVNMTVSCRQALAPVSPPPHCVVGKLHHPQLAPKCPQVSPDNHCLSPPDLPAKRPAAEWTGRERARPLSGAEGSDPLSQRSGEKGLNAPHPTVLAPPPSSPFTPSPCPRGLLIASMKSCPVLYLPPCSCTRGI